MKKFDIRKILDILIVIFFVPYIIITYPFNIFSPDFDWYEMTMFYFYPLVAALLLHQIITKLNLLECYFISFVIIWICFLNVNPVESKQHNKIATLKLIPEEFLPELQCMLSELDINSVELPIIIKPILCSGGGKGIVIIKERTDYDTFMSTVDNIDNFMVQNYLYDHDIEIGLMWERMPWNKKGNVVRIIEKTNVHQDIRYVENDFIINRSHLINDELNRIFDDIGNKLPNVYACRYDIRLKSIDDLIDGKFKILEVNGAMGFSSYNSDMQENGNSLTKYIHKSLWYFRRIMIGMGNIVLLQGYSPVNQLLNAYNHYLKLIKCNDWEELFES